MKTNVLYYNKVKFRDAKYNMFEVEIRVESRSGTPLDYSTAQPINGGGLRLSMAGSYGSAVGQLLDHILPRTETQKELLELWRNYHMNDLVPGTKDQMELTNGCKNYQEAVQKLKEHNLLEDKGYTYGTKWLYKPLPENILQKLKEMVSLLEDEEEQLSNRLAKVFDMGGEKFTPSKDMIWKVMELRDCDETEAKHFVALGVHLGCTLGDLNHTFECQDDNLYQAFGYQYYIGTDDELASIARDIVFGDDEYKFFWIDAVQNGATTKGLDDWREEVLLWDGWASVLNTWDGTSCSYNICDEIMCICRA